MILCDPNPDPQGLLVRLTSLLITLGGMFIFALMVGLVTDGISEYVDDLKKGKSRVLERDHTLILGWSDKVPPLVNELALANESEGEALTLIITLRSASASPCCNPQRSPHHLTGHGTVVILSRKDKEAVKSSSHPCRNSLPNSTPTPAPGDGGDHRRRLRAPGHRGGVPIWGQNQGLTTASNPGCFLSPEPLNAGFSGLGSLGGLVHQRQEHHHPHLGPRHASGDHPRRRRFQKPPGLACRALLQEGAQWACGGGASDFGITVQPR